MAQVAWLNRQLFGRKSEKLRVYDPNMPDLFADSNETPEEEILQGFVVFVRQFLSLAKKLSKVSISA